MASNKECLAVVLDVRQNAAMEMKQNAVKCVADVLKEKICTGKKDFVSFVLLGTQRTYNDPNSNVHHEGYLNIVQYPQLMTPSWDLLVEFMKFANEPSCSDGEWLDALVVAMELLRNSEDLCKAPRHRIVLFHDFDSPNMNYDMFDIITENLAKVEIRLIVVSRNIEFIDNAATGDPQAIFRASPSKPDYQLQNEKYALRLVTNCSAKLCNFTDAFFAITHAENKRPWTWNNTLAIGSKIKIHISGVIAIKDDCKVKLKLCYGSPDEEVSRELKSFTRGEEVQPLPIDMIDGYMLGSTPVAFEELVQDGEEYPPGLTFLGFVKRHAIPEEYYCGDSLYWVVHRKGMTSSAKKMDALVKALLEKNMCILCWKVFSVRLNSPKIVVLLPNKIHDDRPASLSMIELTYHSQHHYWNFPTLRTRKTESTAEQLDAIDNLIDSMDLLLSPDEKHPQRVTRHKDLLPIDTLPNIFELCVLDMLERKVLSAAAEDDPYYEDLVAEKDYKEIFWKVPEAIEQKAKNAANRVKKLFPLEENYVPVVKVKKEDVDGEKNNNNNKDSEKNPKRDGNKLIRVGSISPAEDFEMLLKQEVLTLEDYTLRDSRFNFYADQMRATICKLLFASDPVPADTVAEALAVLRKCSFDFNAFFDYNTWIRRLKAQVVQQKLFDFWSEHVVAKKLGLCVVGEMSLEEKLDLDEFYQIDQASPCDTTAEDEEMNDTSVDELLASV